MAFFSNAFSRALHLSASKNHIMKLTRLRVVDNSELGQKAMAEGRPPKCIHIYSPRKAGTIGDKILVAVKGEKQKAIIVGVRKKQPKNIPSCDTNNIVLIDETGSPLGTRISLPIPLMLRTILKKKNLGTKGVDYTKLLSIAKTFI